MSDDRMDERLRDYAARWTASRPEPGAVVVPAGAPRGRSWAPLAAAACVVALVAGVAFAVTRPPSVTPVGGPSVSPSPVASTPEGHRACYEGDVAAEVVFTPGGPGLAGSLDLRATRGTCTIRQPRLEILGDNLKDLGVRFAFTDDEETVVLTRATPKRVLLEWAPPYCAPPTSLAILMVTITDEYAFRLPLESSLPRWCADTSRTGSRLTARWAPLRCGDAEYDVVSMRPVISKGGIGFDALLRNVSDEHCDIDVKPDLVVTAGGRTLELGGARTLEGRTSPPLPPGGTVRATVWWTTYCGQPIDDYEVALDTGGEAPVPLDVDDHQVPLCPGPEPGGIDGRVSSGWLTRE